MLSIFPSSTRQRPQIPRPLQWMMPISFFSPRMISPLTSLASPAIPFRKSTTSIFQCTSPTLYNRCLHVTPFFSIFIFPLRDIIDETCNMLLASNLFLSENIHDSVFSYYCCQLLHASPQQTPTLPKDALRPQLGRHDLL